MRGIVFFFLLRLISADACSLFFLSFSTPDSFPKFLRFYHKAALLFKSEKKLFKLMYSFWSIFFGFFLTPSSLALAFCYALVRFLTRIEITK